ncbi:hypothetical protein K6L44_07550 [Gluconacetobacter entanii]|uniref:hypothetical protein n=1 Tax=Gluconacetobacter entanii TaxID=108528 RepID=UPI001C931E74|nr:hypothetical protein [Gluconacetobacter entanii]MBY4639843.1 hypothetical protein [Gluconacetobacter entanii]MCW4579954.1 hypothetical protein [Gluconacetobacter entanii]MCW4583362.1 hypothetical protein [Gluconacetobacter entanii]MCW4586688.1 hypothetical protein [Gluconacetobacter entanii]
MMIAADSGKVSGNTDEQIAAMEALLRLGAVDGTRSDLDRALLPDPIHPGYLTREVDGVRLFVPYNLASVCPDSDILLEVIRLSRKVCLGRSNPICISGSTTFLGALKVIADLDFCEYYLLPGGDAEREIAAASSKSDFPLIWMKFGGITYSPPWNCLRDVGAKFMAEPARLKLDFMSTGVLGPMATTNVVLPTSDGEDHSAGDSFVYQEVVIGSNEPLRVLVAPSRFGAYLRFLMENARKYITDSVNSPHYAIKALKRILALMSALGDRSRVGDITEILNRPEIEEIVNKVRVQELESMRPNLQGPASTRFGQKIDDLQDSTSHVTDADVNEALSLARELALSLIEETESEFREYA